ncbi:hypothetical protein [Acinetobacter pittii]|uniref:hypothetical protein n=1 Tax=Acinetobacter pittii TaxID=48296 RepID=UPI00389096B0
MYKKSYSHIDITGEIPVFQYCYEQDQRAKAAGIILCLGAGFDIVLTDCLAASLKERLPEATNIDIGFNFGTRPSIGSIKTAIEGVATGGLIRRNSKLVSVPQGYRIRKLFFQMLAYGVFHFLEEMYLQLAFRLKPQMELFMQQCLCIWACSYV